MSGSADLPGKETIPNDTLLKGYTISDKTGTVIFRYQKNIFTKELNDSDRFVFPAPKIAVVTSGEADWEIGHTSFRVKKGDIAILRPGTIRRFIKISSDAPLRCDIFEFMPMFLYNSDCLNLFMLESSSDNTLVNYEEGGSDRIIELLDCIKNELVDNGLMCSDMIRGLLTCAIALIIRSLKLNFGNDTTSSWNVTFPNNMLNFDYMKDGDRLSPVPTDHSISMAIVMNLIKNQLSGEISIDSLAAAAHMSRSHFFKIFKKYIGMSVNDYIVKCRIENTVKLLLESRCSILDAAYASGFTSSSGFYKAFQKFNGCTPKDYLKKIKKEWKTE